MPDRARVAATVAASTHMTEFLTKMGEPLDRLSRRRWRARFSRWQIDKSHWAQSPGRCHSNEELADAVAASTSMAEVLRRLGIKQAGGSQAHISRRIRSAGLSTAHFRRQAHSRGKPSPNRARPEAVLRVLPPGSSRIKTRQLRRALIAMGVPELCSECGCEPVWRGQPLILIIDHRDGDWLDNRLENLRFLCPNCHAQTATWCRKLSARNTIE
jgi:hypothetical protein